MFIRGFMVSVIKARYDGKVLKPIQDLDLSEGEEVRINIQGSATRKVRGIVKCWEGLDEAHEDYQSNIH